MKGEVDAHINLVQLFRVSRPARDEGMRHTQEDANEGREGGRDARGLFLRSLWQRTNERQRKQNEGVERAHRGRGDGGLLVASAVHRTAAAAASRKLDNVSSSVVTINGA